MKPTRGVRWGKETDFRMTDKAEGLQEKLAAQFSSKALINKGYFRFEFVPYDGSRSLPFGSSHADVLIYLFQNSGQGEPVKIDVLRHSLPRKFGSKYVSRLIGDIFKGLDILPGVEADIPEPIPKKGKPAQENPKHIARLGTWSVPVLDGELTIVRRQNEVCIFYVDLQAQVRNFLLNGLTQFDDERLAKRLRTMPRPQVENLLTGALAALEADGELKGRNLSQIIEKRNSTAAVLLREWDTVRYVPQQLPSLPSEFVGRSKDLDLLRAQTPINGVLQVGLHGMGGSGKTTLAVALSNEWKVGFPDGQLYLPLGRSRFSTVQSEEEQVRQWLQVAIRAFGSNNQLPTNTAELEGMYRDTLSSRRVLIVLDNVQNPKQIKPFFPPPGCGLIATSRYGFSLGAALVHYVGCMTDEDATGLLLRLYPHLSNKEIRALIELCARLPLALCIAGSFLSVQGRTRGSRADVEGYIVGLSAKRLATLDAGSVYTPEESVTHTLQLSEEALTPDEQRAWWCLNIFPADFDVQAAHAVAGVPEELLNMLVERSMVERIQERYQLHELVRDYTSTCMGEAWQLAARENHALHYCRVLEDINTALLQGGDDFIQGLQRFDVEWINIESGQTWSSLNAHKREEIARACVGYACLGANAFSLRQHPRLSLKWNEEALKAGGSLSTPSFEDKKWKAIVLHNTGLAHSNLGDMRQAIAYYKQSLTLFTELKLPYHEIICHINCGWAFSQLKRRKAAFQQYHHALRALNQIDDPTTHDVAKINVFGNLAIAYKNVGRRDEALILHKEALAVSQHIGDLRTESYQLGGIGIIHDIDGEYDLAIQMYTRQRIISKKIGDQRGHGKAILNTAISRHNQGKTGLALRLAEKSRVILQSIGDPEAANAEKYLRKWRSKYEVSA